MCTGNNMPVENRSTVRPSSSRHWRRKARRRAKLSVARRYPIHPSPIFAARRSDGSFHPARRKGTSATSGPIEPSGRSTPAESNERTWRMAHSMRRPRSDRGTPAASNSAGYSPPTPTPIAEPARGEGRQRCELLRQYQRLTQRQQHDARPERDPLRRCRHNGQGDDGLQDGMGVQQVVADVHPIKTGGFGLARRLDDTAWFHLARVEVGHGRKHQPNEWPRSVSRQRSNRHQRRGTSQSYRTSRPTPEKPRPLRPRPDGLAG